MSAPRVASLTELLDEHADATYREVLRVPALSLGLFAAAPGHDDLQSPHGRSRLTSDRASRSARRSAPTTARPAVQGQPVLDSTTSSCANVAHHDGHDVVGRHRLCPAGPVRTGVGR